MAVDNPVPRLELHPQFKLILEALTRGESAKSIARWIDPHVTPQTISRFRRLRLAKVMQEAAAAPIAMAHMLQQRGLLANTEEVTDIVEATAQSLAADDPLMRRIRKIYDTLDDSMITEQTKKKKNTGAICGIISQDLKAIELEARLTHRMDNPIQGVNITIHTPQNQAQKDKGPVVMIGVKS